MGITPGHQQRAGGRDDVIERRCPSPRRISVLTLRAPSGSLRAVTISTSITLSPCIVALDLCEKTTAMTSSNLGSTLRLPGHYFGGIPRI